MSHSKTRWVLILMFSAVLLGTAAYVALDELPPSPKTPGVHIVINKASNKLYLYSHNALVETYPVATGRTPDATPQGGFEIGSKAEFPEGFPDNPDVFGSRWMGLRVPGGREDLKYGIHGTDQPESIGTHASKGCIRLRNDDANDLYTRVEAGTPVFIASGSPLTRWLHDLFKPAPPPAWLHARGP